MLGVPRPEGAEFPGTSSSTRRLRSGCADSRNKAAVPDSARRPARLPGHHHRGWFYRLAWPRPAWPRPAWPGPARPRPARPRPAWPRPAPPCLAPPPGSGPWTAVCGRDASGPRAPGARQPGRGVAPHVPSARSAAPCSRPIPAPPGGRRGARGRVRESVRGGAQAPVHSEASLGNAGRPPLGRRPALQHPKGRGSARTPAGEGGLLIIIFTISGEGGGYCNNLGARPCLPHLKFPAA